MLKASLRSNPFHENSTRAPPQPPAAGKIHACRTIKLSHKNTPFKQICTDPRNAVALQKSCHDLGLQSRWK